MRSGGRAFPVDVIPSLTPAPAGALADAAFEVFRAAWAPLLVLSAATNVPVFASVAGLVLFIRERGWAWGSLGYFAALALLSIATALTFWLRAVGTGAMAHACATAVAGHPAGPTSSFAAAVRAGAALPVGCALRALAVVIGVAACLLPGITAGAGLAFVPHSVVLERRRVVGSVVRSLSLATAGATGLAAAGALVAAIYAVGTAQLALGVRLLEALVTLAVPSAPGGWLLRPEAPWLVLGAAKALADPIVSAASTAVWIDARIRADGIDLDLRVQAIAGEAPTLLALHESEVA